MLKSKNDQGNKVGWTHFIRNLAGLLSLAHTLCFQYIVDRSAFKNSVKGLSVIIYAWRHIQINKQQLVFATAHQHYVGIQRMQDCLGPNKVTLLLFQQQFSCAIHEKCHSWFKSAFKLWDNVQEKLEDKLFIDFLPSQIHPVSFHKLSLVTVERQLKCGFYQLHSQQFGCVPLHSARKRQTAQIYLGTTCFSPKEGNQISLLLVYH